MTGGIRAEVVQALRARLQADEPDHPDFKGPPVAGLPLAPFELGELQAELLAAANDVRRPAAQRLAQHVLAVCRMAGVTARFGTAAAERTLAGPLGQHPVFVMRVLAGCDDEPTPALRAHAQQLLAQAVGAHALAHHGDAAPLPLPPALDNAPGVHVLRLPALALARVAGEPWLSGVLALHRALRPAARALNAERDALALVAPCTLALLAADIDWYQGGRDENRPDAAVALADEPAFVAHARACLEDAAARLADLHAGRLPYVADRLFALDDTAALSRAARVAAMRDEAWFRPLVGPLLARAAVAPTAAKTTPSQSLAIALGWVVEGYPTPEGVQALQDALAVVRHAGVEKKLERHLKPARRGLAARPEIALRLLAGMKVDRKQQAVVATCLESTFTRPGDWALADWRAQVAATPNGAPFALAQVWRLQAPGGAAVAVRALRDGDAALRFVDVAGAAVAAWDDARIALWHPLQSSPAERAAWQGVVAGLRVRQPVRQVFREVYEVAAGERDALATAAFAGHRLRLPTLIGLARGEGWALPHWGGLTRRFGDLRARLEVGGRLHPGMGGEAASGGLEFHRWGDRRWEPLPLGELDPVVYSEACRAVDLLVSASAFALDEDPASAVVTSGATCMRPVARAPAPEPPGSAAAVRRARLQALGDEPLGVTAAMRRRALELALAPAVASGRVAIEARHVRVGGATVHLATGRIVQDGAALDLAPPAPKATRAAVPWLPYDEVLLQRIVDNVSALLAR